MSDTLSQPGLESLSKSFEPTAIEAYWGPEWERRGYSVAGFRGTGQPKDGAPSFSIQLPPPNVTGTLHMGHAFNQTIMDSLDALPPHARRQHAVGAGHRPRGHRHPDRGRAPAAGTEGQSRHDLGRKNFVARVWEWKEKSGNTITQPDAPHGRLGRLERASTSRWTTSCRRSSPRPSCGCTKQGLIYRGKRLVNWDPVLKTAVCDLEVESEEEDGFLWHIALPAGRRLGLAHGRHHAARNHARRRRVMVHPEDERYKRAGRQARQAAAGATAMIPVIADDYVDREFGTGVVKVTPAHDPNDYAVGQRHEPADHRRADAGRHDQRQRAREIPRARPLRRAQGRSWPTSRRSACWSKPRSTS